MNLFDYLYAACFCVSYDNLPIGRKFNAEGYACLFTGSATAGWLCVVVMVCLRVMRIHPSSTNTKYIILLIALICNIIAYLYYSSNDRSSRLYDEYKSRHKVMPRITFAILAPLFICAPYFVAGFL